MVHNDSDRMGCSLNILSPLSKSEDDCKELMIIDVIILFGWEERREVGTGMEITIGISLE